ncbi:MAG: hexitol phosphatase HxpB [Planctomycetaceae bacterium]|nr:hexitol phosphatase HxpB [Planctomycetaceae bacterium]
MIEAVVFDMDGVLIDSQPFWQTAQLEILSQLGVPITRQDTIDTTGVRIDHIVQQCYHKTPWDSVSCEEVCGRIMNRVKDLVQQRKPAMPGLDHAIDVCRSLELKLALASSSPISLIHTTIEALQLDGVFEVKASGENLRYGKPHPEVYLNACHELNVVPERCVAIEDSFVGLLAAKAARMNVIVIPEPSSADQENLLIADYQLASLTELTSDLFQSF